MRKLDIADEALEFWNALDAKQYRQIRRKALSLLRTEHPHDAQELKGYAGFLRVDCGEFRIIYRINDDTIRIDLIGHRNDDDVYKKFERRFQRKYATH